MDRRPRERTRRARRLRIGLGGGALVVVVAAALLLLDVRPEAATVTGFDPGRLPDRPDEAAFAGFGEADRLVGFSGQDLRATDLRGVSAAWLAAQTFDTRTRWPDAAKLPRGARPADWLEAGRDPGLGVRGLQREGLIGDGVTVAVIDKPMRSDHREFAGRLTYHPGTTATGAQARLHFHGIAVASLLAGLSCGVAPGALVHYFAVPDDGRNAEHYAQALQRVAEFNRGRPSRARIRLVVISDGVFPDERGWRSWQRGVEAARASGAAVLTSRDLERSGFVWGGAAPGRYRNAPGSYRLALRLAGRELPDALTLVPGDFRTRATNDGPATYAYSGEGGMSWAIPYVGGVVALGLELDDRLELDRALALLRATAAENGEGRKVIDPVAFVRAVAEDARTSVAP